MVSLAAWLGYAKIRHWGMGLMRGGILDVTRRHPAGVTVTVVDPCISTG